MKKINLILAGIVLIVLALVAGFRVGRYARVFYLSPLPFIKPPLITAVNPFTDSEKICLISKVGPTALEKLKDPKTVFNEAEVKLIKECIRI